MKKQERIPSKLVELTQEKKLELLSQLGSEYADLRAELEATLESMGNFNPKPKPRTRPPRGYEELGRQLTSVLRRIADIRDETKALGSARFLVQDDEVSSPTRRRPATRKVNVFVQVRDLTIRKYSDLPNEEICRKLDAELMQHDDASPFGLPEGWTEQYGAKGYLEAYQKPELRNRVQKMLWNAKQGI